MTSTQIDLIEEALQERNLEFAIDIFSTIQDKKIQDKSRKFFRIYLRKHFAKMPIHECSSIACIFADYAEYQNEYNQICAKINDYLETKQQRNHSQTQTW